MRYFSKISLFLLISLLLVLPFAESGNLCVCAAKSSSSVSSSESNSDNWSLNESVQSESDGDSFGFIKDSKNEEDNGEWILYCGISLIVLSVIGILYVIFSSVKKKR